MESLISLVIIVVTGLAVYAIIKTNPSRGQAAPVRSTPYDPKLPREAPALHWSDEGRFLVEVVNESRYQPVIKELAGVHGEQSAAAPYMATLVPDDANPYESTAVIVFLGDHMVGSLAPKAAIR